MQPFLSPARIVLLTLIDMYCGDVIREDDDDFVLQLISSYLLESYERPTNGRQRFLARWQRAYLNVDLLTHVHSLRPALQGCFIAQASAALPLCATLWDHLVQRLWMQLQSLDSLASFFENIHMHIAPTYSERRLMRENDVEEPPDTLIMLERRSPMGLLVHQAYIEFDHLSFAGRCELWEDFVRYRHPTRADYKILWPHDYPAAEALFDGILTKHQEDWDTHTDAIARVVFDRVAKDDSVTASLDETEKLVAQLIDRERLGFRPSSSLRTAVDKAIDGSTLVPNQAIFFRMLDAWRMGDANTVYDQLHRFFDLVARQGTGASFGYNMGPMNKAVIERDFGEHSNDLLSMLDAVHSGREARDYNSLRFALVWLYMYARVLPRHIRPHELQGLAGQPTDGQQVLPYVREDADAAKFHAHHTLASLIEARVALGDGRPPLFAITCLREASRNIVAHGETGLEGQLTGTLMIFWDRMGSGALAISHGRSFMKTRHDDVPFDDAVRVACRLAMQYAQGGQFGKAKAVVMGLNPDGLTSMRAKNTIRHVLTYVAAIQAVRAHRFPEAEDLLLRQLPANGFPSCAPVSVDRKSQGPSQLDPDLAMQAALLHVSLLSRQEDGSLVAARTALDNLEAFYDKGVADLHMLLEMSLARIDLYIKAGHGLRVFKFAVRTVQACLRRRYYLLLWQSVGALARLLVAEGEFQAARTLLDTIIPRSLETNHVETTGLLYQDLADACMGLAGQEEEAITADPTQARRRVRQKQHFSKAWWSLGQALVYFRRAGCPTSVEKDIAAKRQIILSVAQSVQ